MTDETQKFTKGMWADVRFGPHPNFTLSDVEAAWIACAIDGEGTIAIQRNFSYGKVRYRPKVYVCNTNLDFLGKVSQLVDGCTSIKNTPRKPHHKLCYQVFVRARAIRRLLEQILLPSDHELFEHLYLECKALNKKGI